MLNCILNTYIIDKELLIYLDLSSPLDSFAYAIVTMDSLILPIMQSMYLVKFLGACCAIDTTLCIKFPDETNTGSCADVFLRIFFSSLLLANSSFVICTPISD